MNTGNPSHRAWANLILVLALTTSAPVAAAGDARSTEAANGSIVAATATTTTPGAADSIRLDEDLRKRAHYLQTVIHKYDGDSPTMRRLERYNGEWPLLTYAFSAYAFANLAFADPGYRMTAVRNIDQAIRQSMTETVYRGYDFPGFPFRAEENRGNVFYLGHLNLMLGLFKLVGGFTKYDTLHADLTDYLATSIDASPFMNIETYPGMVWPSDNVTALTSLALHDLAHDTDYTSTCVRWVEWTREHLYDEHGLVYSEIDHRFGRSRDTPRGCALAWTAMFAAVFDREFAEEQYAGLISRYASRVELPLAGDGFLAVKDRVGETATGMGDIDSGPMLNGYAVSSTGFTIGAAMVLGDRQTADQILRLVDFIAPSQDDAHSRWYTNLSFMLNSELNWSPLGDALLLCCRTMTIWDGRYLTGEAGQ